MTGGVPAHFHIPTVIAGHKSRRSMNAGVGVTALRGHDMTFETSALPTARWTVRVPPWRTDRSSAST